MIEVGESTGALPQMLASVAEFYEDDVNTRMTAALVADRARHHDFHGLFRDVRIGGAVFADLLFGGHAQMKKRGIQGIRGIRGMAAGIQGILNSSRIPFFHGR
jgi:DNA invertase Pin-like site-specific DNA recombinase